MEKLLRGTLYNFSPLRGFVIPGNLALKPKIYPMLSLPGLLFQFQLIWGLLSYYLLKTFF